MSYSEEINRQVDFRLAELIKMIVKEAHIHPLEPDFLRMMEGKIAASAVEVWTKMGKPSKEEFENVPIN